MNKNQKGNGRARDARGRFVSLAAIYSTKHNTVDLEKVYEEKMKEWEEQGLAKAVQVVRPFDYRPEAYKVPENYNYTTEEIKKLLSDNYNYVLEMVDLTNVNIEEPETISFVAKMVAPINSNMKTFYFKNSLCVHEGLTLLHVEYIDKDADFYIPFTSEPKNVETLFQGVVAKRKLKDLVIDTYYKLDFNKSVRTHYIHKGRLNEDYPIHICRYWSNPIKYWKTPNDEFGYKKDISAVIFTKTKFDEDGDVVIETIPIPKYILKNHDNGFLVYSLDGEDVVDIRSLSDLTKLVPNLLIPEDMLRRLARLEILNNKGTLTHLGIPAPEQKCVTEPIGFNTRPEQPLGFGVRLNLGLHMPIEILAIDEVNDYKRSVKTYRLGEFRAPRKEGEIPELDTFNVDSGHFYLATGPKDLWILIDENLDKIYFYNSHENKIVDWCLTTTFDFLNLLNRFSSSFLTEETKGDLVKAMNNILKNYYSKGVISAEKNEGLTGFLKNM